MIALFTIGFTQKSARQFFDLLLANNIAKLIDVRINNVSQLAGFAKGKDLQFFLDKICNIKYQHIIDFAPTKTLLNQWRKKEITWEQYSNIYTNLLNVRTITTKYDFSTMDHACFLCSEDRPEYCHRRLLAEYIKEKLNEDVNIVHLF